MLQLELEEVELQSHGHELEPSGSAHPLVPHTPVPSAHAHCAAARGAAPAAKSSSLATVVRVHPMPLLLQAPNTQCLSLIHI